MSKVISLKEAIRGVVGAHAGVVKYNIHRVERDEVGRGAEYHTDVATAARLLAEDYLKDPASFGPRGWPQVGGILSAREGAKALVLHSKQTPTIRANLLAYHEELSKLGLDDPRANPEGMDAVLERLVHQVEHYHPEALVVLHKRTRAAVLDLTKAGSQRLLYKWLVDYGTTWLDLVFDEHGQPLPEDSAELIALAVSLWPTSEAAAALPRWGLSEEEVSEELAKWLKELSEGDLVGLFDVQPSTGEVSQNARRYVLLAWLLNTPGWLDALAAERAEAPFTSDEQLAEWTCANWCGSQAFAAAPTSGLSRQEVGETLAAFFDGEMHDLWRLTPHLND